MESRPNDRKSVAMMVSSMLIFGTIGIFRKNIPLSSAFLPFSRGILGGLFIWIPSLLKRKKDGASSPRPSLRSLPWLALTGALIGFNWILLFEAYRCTTVAVATLCYYMQPTLVILLSPLVFRERLTVGHQRSFCQESVSHCRICLCKCLDIIGSGSILCRPFEQPERSGVNVTAQVCRCRSIDQRNSFVPQFAKDDAVRVAGVGKTDNHPIWLCHC
jgi:uncharacterized membrane protein